MIFCFVKSDKGKARTVIIYKYIGGLALALIAKMCFTGKLGTKPAFLHMNNSNSDIQCPNCYASQKEKELLYWQLSNAKNLRIQV